MESTESAFTNELCRTSVQGSSRLWPQRLTKSEPIQLDMGTPELRVLGSFYLYPRPHTALAQTILAINVTRLLSKPVPLHVSREPIAASSSIGYCSSLPQLRSVLLSLVVAVLLYTSIALRVHMLIFLPPR
jgi:hypothetical protein